MTPHDADAAPPAPDTADSPDDDVIHEPRLWRDQGWTARVVKNEDDDGWAVAMFQDGQAEPALVGPWTMGRDKKNPKPLDTPAFNTLVKTAREVLRRHEQQLAARLHRQFDVTTDDGRVTVCLDIVPDEFDPYARLSATDAFGHVLAEHRVSPTWRLDAARAREWVEAGFPKPGR